jgi:hypothetical protein
MKQILNGVGLKLLCTIKILLCLVYLRNLVHDFFCYLGYIKIMIVFFFVKLRDWIEHWYQDHSPAK